MRREIPQKVDAQVSVSAQNTSGSTARLGATLFHRTRSASVLSITLTATALGMFIPQAKAAAYFSESSTPVDTVPSFPESNTLEQRSTPSGMLAPISSETGIEPLPLSTEFTTWKNPDLVVPSARINFSTTSNRLSELELLLPGEAQVDSLNLPLETSVLPANDRSSESDLALGAGSMERLATPVTGSAGKLQQSGALVHTVEHGENLIEIAGQYAVSPETIAQTNRIQDPNVIDVDENLVIPAINLSAAMMPFVLGSTAPQSETVSRSAAQLGVAPSLLEPRKATRVTLPQSQPSLAKPAVAGSRSNASEPMGTSSSAVSNEPTLPPQPTPSTTPKAYRGSEVLIARASVFPKFPPALELPPLNSAEDFLPPSMNGLQKYIWPAQGAFTSGYGPRWGRMHRGIDIAAPVGTPVVASAPGVVVTAGWNDGGYGNLVEIRHPDGSLTLYAHNSRLVARKGAVVNQGELIAAMGSTGRSTGPHTHFEIHPGGRGAVDPMFFLSRK